MSRCYPYPPPGYAGKCSSHEALILSIKLQKEKEKALSAQEGEKSKSFEKKKDKEDRKDKKRDREDRKKDKKDKEERKKEKKEKKEKRREKKAKLTANTESGKQDFVADKLAKAGNVLPESEGKLQGNSCELVERSSVTEEHGQPIDSQNVSCSSDSTGNSGKRRKTLPSPTGTLTNGKILRIRLSTSQKRDEASTSGSKLQEVGSLLQRREDLVASYSNVRPCVAHIKPESSNKQKGLISTVECLPCPASTSNATLQLVSTDGSGFLKQKTIDSLSQNVNPASSHEEVQIKAHPIEKLSSRERRMRKKDSLYKKLIVDWVPPPLESTLMVDEDEEEDWLFGKKGDNNSAKSLRVGADAGSSARDCLPCSASYAMQPRARYLADAEIFALPFTVPF